MYIDITSEYISNQCLLFPLGHSSKLGYYNLHQKQVQIHRKSRPLTNYDNALVDVDDPVE